MKTTAERCKNWRNKMQGNVAGNEFRKKEAERLRVYRKKLKEKVKHDSELANIIKLAGRERQKRFSEKKKKKEEETPAHKGYTCKQTFGKALKKVERALPKDLVKKKEVIGELYKKYFCAEEPTLDSEPTDDEETTRVQEFFVRDDISVQSAGRKQTKVANKNSTPVSQRFMVLTVNEAYQLFKTEFPSSTISRTKFYRNRPKTVLLSRDMPHNMCVCKCHANFCFLLESISKVIPQFPSKFYVFLQSLCCDVENEKCMSGECENCTSDVTDALIPLDCVTKLNDNVAWKHWNTIENRMTLNQSESPVFHLISVLEAQLPSFKLHCFIKQTQQKYFENIKRNIKPGQLILQIDFAENYRLATQNEVQSAHFNYTQVTIFTCVAWLCGKVRSFAVVSDKLTHNKFDVYCFLTTIIKKIKKQEEVTKISIFSDGCASQFKNKYILSSIPNLVDELMVNELEWNFFATSHGKGAVDGVGAVVKRKVWEVVRTTNIVLHTASDFYKCANQHLANINMMYFSSDQIEKESTPLCKRWEKVKNIPALQRAHSFSYVDNRSIYLSRTATSVKTKLVLGKLII